MTVYTVLLLVTKLKTVSKSDNYIKEASIAMSPAEKLAAIQTTDLTELRHLSPVNRLSAARSIYAPAVELYASTQLSIREIAETTGITPKALSHYLSKHHRPLLYKRYNIEMPEGDRPVKIKSPRGQSRATHLKYKEAIEASGDIAYVEYNISEIARLFGVNPTGLSSQLRVHYPHILPAREALRKRLGIADGRHRGAKPASKSAYENAVPLYKDTDLTIQEVADSLGISRSGFGQYMRFYHHEAIEAKARRRREAKRVYHQRETGNLSGNGQKYGPKKETEIQYESALRLYREGHKNLKEVIRETGVSSAGFKHYLDQWQREARRSRKEVKYGDAIASLRENPRPVAQVASEYSLKADVFREYLKKHVPDLAQEQGMVRLDNGRLVKKTVWDKYHPAVDEYRKEGGSLRAIALKHGLKYISLFSFVKRIDSN